MKTDIPVTGAGIAGAVIAEQHLFDWPQFQSAAEAEKDSDLMGLLAEYR
jgi:hypothetical protein